ncbi:MAG: hypothetical protein E4G98_05265 [Promethearchaeota archaeon]|nr:MAG: hypothetical protein E4G98_05265 [Candidatus Lokiarchaeota archaeon]
MSIMRRRMESSKTGLLITIPLYLIWLGILIVFLIIPAIRDRDFDTSVFIGGAVSIFIGIRLVQAIGNLKNIIQNERQTAQLARDDQNDSNPNREDDLRQRIKVEKGY